MTSGSGDRPRKEGSRGGGVYSFFPGSAEMSGFQRTFTQTYGFTKQGTKKGFHHMTPKQLQIAMMSLSLTPPPLDISIHIYMETASPVAVKMPFC